ncbi:MAG: M3 family metallopeptidase [Bacteroidales bacterium]|nr:M3 family metallopeptidase [Bacteroidales bacterium]MBN2818269.1 M3 family metallopeptidase [Bacteroidales bacterium]
MKRIIYLFIISALAITSCKKDTMTKNPLLADWNTPFHVPPFDEIKNENYLPAFEEAIKMHQHEIDVIITNSTEPNFENTIYPLDKSGDLLQRISLVFFNIDGANTSEEIQQIALKVGPMLNEHYDNIFMNEELYNKVKVVYEKRNDSKLDKDQLRVVKKYNEQFTRRGVNLPEEKKNRVKELNEKITNLTLKFGQNLLAETNNSLKLVIDNKEDLSGLPENIVSAAAEQAKNDSMPGNWVFTLNKPSLIPFLQYADKRDLREKIYRGYFMRGNNSNEFDNKDILREIAELRAERAEILGFKNHAEYVIDVNMAKTPENVYDFLNKVWTPALNLSKTELSEMQALADANGDKVKLESWDWWYYAEKLRKQKYDLDEAELKPYFKLDNVRDGMFWVANKLYGVSFEKLEDIPIYHPEVEVFEAKEADGTHIGLLYLDYFPRESKGGGAWCTTFQDATYRDGKKIPPVVSIVTNFTKPTEDTPSLLTWDEVTTLFHEFGHALHALFTEGKYNKTAGVVAQDYVELPSQVMENWAAEPEVMKHYGKHYQTGNTIPDELIKKIQNSSHFNQGFAMVEYIAASILDLDYHMLSSRDSLADVLAFEKASMDKIGLIPEIIPRYRSTYFAHIFSGGYSAGYYVYMWAEVLDADAFSAFKESGDIFNQDLASKFRKHCLAESGDDDGMVQYKKFRGQEPTVDALLNKRGISE